MELSSFSKNYRSTKLLNGVTVHATVRGVSLGSRPSASMSTGCVVSLRRPDVHINDWKFDRIDAGSDSVLTSIIHTVHYSHETPQSLHRLLLISLSHKI